MALEAAVRIMAGSRDTLPASVRSLCRAKPQSAGAGRDANSPVLLLIGLELLFGWVNTIVILVVYLF